MELLTDASHLKGVSLMLIQRGPNNQIHLIQCGSCSILPTESSYATIELECLAIKFDIHKCHFHIFGLNHFTIITDHCPLEGIFQKDLYLIPDTCIHHYWEVLMDISSDAKWFIVSLPCNINTLNGIIKWYNLVEYTVLNEKEFGSFIIQIYMSLCHHNICSMNTTDWDH